MKTHNKLSAYILHGSVGALLLSCVIVALCSAINLPNHSNAAFGANASPSRTLSFGDRVAYQTAIEDIYWRHRIWPNTNAGPKPSLDTVMSQAQLERKVEDYLRNSQTLEGYWQRPITGDQLQAEMERMASHTKQPEVLQELFEALGKDAFVIAECLARPVLTERLIADVSVQHQTGRFDSLRTADLQMPRKVAAIDLIAKAVQVNRPYTLPAIASPSGGCTDDTWTPTTLTNAPAARHYHTAVWTGSEMIVWGGRDPVFNTGGRYNPSTDSWTATSTMNAPSARYDHTAVWTGSEMIVWGGWDGAPANTGGRYNPSTDSWTDTSIINAPAARYGNTVVWTGSEMIVWGGWDFFVLFNTGGRYNPSTDSWTATSTTNAPTTGGPAVWTGSEMIVWGGFDGLNWLNTGGRYNPSTDSWTATSTTDAPTGRRAPTVWTGSQMIIWGGFDGNMVNTGGRYSAITDSWTATSIINVPDARDAHAAVWTGTEMIIWGGSGVTWLNTGGRYCAAVGNPTPTPTTSPSPTATATATATTTPSATPTPGLTPRATPIPRARPTPVPRP